MRWFVDISLIGSGGKASRFCVEAEQWQKALQAVREQRKDASPFANFSIELLEDGYRAIDPATRTRYVVQKAPEDAALTDQPVEIQGNPSVPPPPKDGGARGGRARRRGAAPIPNDPVPAQKATNGAPAAPPDEAPTPAPAPAAAPAPTAAPAPAPAAPPRPAPPRTPTPAPIARPMQAETAFEKMTQGVSFPLAGQPAAVEVTTQILPPFKIVAERTQLPSDASPIHYKEVALAVASGTSERDAEAISRAQFELIRAALRDAPAGQFINLAVFDHEFDGRPKRPPLVTLSFKDWRDKEPAISFVGKMSLPPPPAETEINPDKGVPPEARRSEPRSEPPATASPPAAAPPAAAPPATAPPAAAPPAAAPPAAAPEAAPPPSRRAPPPPTPSSIRRAAASMDDDVTAVKPEVPVEPPPSAPRWTPPPQASARVAEKTAPMTIVAIPPAPESVTSVGAPPTMPSETDDLVEIEAAPVAERRSATISVEEPPPAPPAPEPAPPVIPDEPAYDATARIMGAPIVSVGVSAAADGQATAAVQPAPAPTPGPALEVAPPSTTEESERMAPTQFEPHPSGVERSSPPPPAAPSSGVSPAAYSSPGSQPPPRPWGTEPTSSQPPPEPRAPSTPSFPAVSPSAPPPAPVFAQATSPTQAMSPSTPPPADPIAEARPASIPPAVIPSPSTPPPSIAPGSAKPRSSGDDLIAELFESMSDIAFLSDSLDGAEFALRVTLEALPSELAIVSFFSLDSREFVAVRVAGTAAQPAIVEAVLLKRSPEKSPVSHRAMRSNQAVVLDAASAAALADDPRWAQSKLQLQSVMCAPVALGGRYLGLIEVANPLDGEPFTNADGNALTYIGQQLAEFLGQRDTTIDAERVRAPKLASRMRR